MQPTSEVEILVVGGGPAGLAAATALALGGGEVAVAAARQSGPDGTPAAPETRTAALFPASIALLKNIGAWADVAATSAPLRAIRIVDDTGALLKAPTVTFDAADIGLTELGFNVPNAELVVALRAAARRAGVVLLDDGAVTAVAPGPQTVEATLASGRRVRSKLLVAADGRGSVCRAAAGIGVQRWACDQTALAVRFDHSRPHQGISTELHRPAGPLTTVPMPGLSSSLVWVERPAVAERLSAATAADFVAELSERLGGLLGTISNLGPRRAFPLQWVKADTLARGRVALVGEAGHAIPPIGAQGLNLGLYDVGSLAAAVSRARRAGDDIGAETSLRPFAREREQDMGLRMGAVDVLNRTLTSGLLPVDLARGAVLHLLAAVPALRRGVMRRGLGPAEPLPPLLVEGHAGAAVA